MHASFIRLNPDLFLWTSQKMVSISTNSKKISLQSIYFHTIFISMLEIIKFVPLSGYSQNLFSQILKIFLTLTWILEPIKHKNRYFITFIDYVHFAQKTGDFK